MLRMMNSAPPPRVTLRPTPDRRRTDAELIRDLERARGDVVAALQLLLEKREALERAVHDAATSRDGKRSSI